MAGCFLKVKRELPLQGGLLRSPVLMWRLWSCSAVKMELKIRSYGVLVSALRLPCCRLCVTESSGVGTDVSLEFLELGETFFWGLFEHVVHLFLSKHLYSATRGWASMLFLPLFSQGTMLQAIERYMKQAIVDKVPSVSSSALVSSLVSAAVNCCKSVPCVVGLLHV